VELEFSGIEEDVNLNKDVEKVMRMMNGFSLDAVQVRQNLELCDVTVSPELVTSVLSRIRNDWSAAYCFFLWAGRKPEYRHSVREYHTMISILGKFRKFDTAWGLINEMRRFSPSIVTPQTLTILIRRYAAAHEVAKTIGAFYAHKKFGLTPGITEFHSLLSALCRYKNVEDAEHLLLCNEKTYPFETKSFNIILNGWCNAMVFVGEAKRFWRNMEIKGIPMDVMSYGSMISCFSKVGNLSDVLKLFDRMRDSDIEPDIKIHNSVIYALAKSKCVKEATDLLRSMEKNEKGKSSPNAVTYNSLIRPLCKAGRTEEARAFFDEMISKGLSPCIRTFHAFFRNIRTTDEVFDLLDSMKSSNCKPEIETYIMLIRKLCRWRQYDKVFELWQDIHLNGPFPDRSAYIVLIHGLFLNGKLDEAHKYYEEMKSRGFSPEPRTEAMVQTWLSGKEMGGGTKQDSIEVGIKKKKTSKRDYKRPETRDVTRESGFSFWHTARE